MNPTWIVALLLFAMPASAQVGTFGSQVLYGDADYQPLLKKTANQPYFYEADLGVVGDVTDNCIYMRVETNAAAPATGTRAPTTKKDLRMHACQGKAPGTQYADDDLAERLATYAFVPASIQYADVNGNGKYDKGDFVYAVADTTLPNVGANDPQANAGEFPNGLVASTAPGRWTLRLTPALGYQAGTLVKLADADFVAHHASAKKENFVVAEREDKVWYLMPGQNAVTTDATTTPATMGGVVGALEKKILLGQEVPANSIRIGITGTPMAQPGLQVLDVAVADPDGIHVGKPFSVTVTAVNNGKAPGAGLLVTRIGAMVADARMGPVLGAGERTTLVLPLVATAPGIAELRVNDHFQVVSVQGESDADARIAQLESRLAALEAGPGAVQPASAQANKAPGPELALFLVVLGFAVVTLRRRA